LVFIKKSEVGGCNKPQVVHKKNYLKSLLLLSTSMKLKYRKKSMLNYEEFKKLLSHLPLLSQETTFRK